MIVLFDIDDTLIDHISAFEAGALALHGRLALDESADSFRIRWRDAHRRHYARYLAGEVSHDEQRRARMREMTAADLSDGDADLAFKVFVDVYEASWRLYPDALPCLDRLAGHRLGIISNGEPAQQRRKLAHLGIAGRFDTVCVSGDRGWAKPDARIFHHACACLNAAPADAAYVGDNYALDAEGARAAGLRGIWLDRAGSAGPVHLPPVIRTLDELPALIESV